MLLTVLWEKKTMILSSDRLSGEVLPVLRAGHDSTERRSGGQAGGGILPLYQRPSALPGYRTSTEKTPAAMILKASPGVNTPPLRARARLVFCALPFFFVFSSPSFFYY